MPEWLRLDQTWSTVKSHLPTLSIALGVLIGGWFVAYIIQRIDYSILVRTELDNKIAKRFGLKAEGLSGNRLERLIARTVYWMLLCIVFILFFSALKVEAVTSPLLTIVNEVAGAIPNIIKAAVM